MSERAPEASAGNGEQFTDILIEWELFFATASEEEINENMGPAQDELDQHWSHMGELCIYSGNAIYPIVHEDDEIETASGEIEDHIGISTGITILRLNDESPKIFFSFSLSTTIESKGPTCVDVRRLTEFVETDGSITPIGKIEDAFVEIRDSNPQSVEVDKHGYLSQASDNYVRLLRSTYFRRLPRSKQESLVRNYIQQVEEQSGVRATDIMVETKVLYKHRLSDDKVDYDYSGYLDETVQGICHGLTSLELLKLGNKAIRCDMDMIDRDAGLCLVVEDFTNQDEDNEDWRGEIVLVPISGQNLEVIFESGDEGESTEENKLNS